MKNTTQSPVRQRINRYLRMAEKEDDRQKRNKTQEDVESIVPSKMVSQPLPPVPAITMPMSTPIQSNLEEIDRDNDNEELMSVLRVKSEAQSQSPVESFTIEFELLSECESRITRNGPSHHHHHHDSESGDEDSEMDAAMEVKSLIVDDPVGVGVNSNDGQTGTGKADLEFGAESTNCNLAEEGNDSKVEEVLASVIRKQLALVRIVSEELQRKQAAEEGARQRVEASQEFTQAELGGPRNRGLPRGSVSRGGRNRSGTQRTAIRNVTEAQSTDNLINQKGNCGGVRRNPPRLCKK